MGAGERDDLVIAAALSLEREQLRDYCAGIMDDDFDDPSRSSSTGY